MSEQLKRLALAAYQAKVDAQNKVEQQEKEKRAALERKASEQIMDLLRKELSAEVLDGLPDFTFTYEPWGAELKANVHFLYLDIFWAIAPSIKNGRVDHWELQENEMTYYTSFEKPLERILLEHLGEELDRERRSER